ncbi:hypothetical protein CATMIT_01675, partial [Catenibacterium mitsuokai DSM 15897]
DRTCAGSRDWPAPLATQIQAISGGQGDDRDRVDRLEPRGREHPLAAEAEDQVGHGAAEDVAVDDLVGEEGEGAAGLFEEHPEQDVEGEDDQHRDDLVALLRAFAEAFHQQQAAQAQEHRGQHALQRGGAHRQQEVHRRDRDQRAEEHVHDLARILLAFRRHADALEAGAAEPEPHQADQHAHAGGDEHHLVVRQRFAAEDLLGQVLGQQRRQHRAEVDAHVEDGEARVAALVGDRVELADHGRDVRLEQAVAADDRGQAELEDLLVRQRDHEQTGRHDDRAEQDRALVAEHAVG